MPRQRPSREEIESSLEFIAALSNGDLSEVSGAGRSKEDRSLLAHELLSAAEDATHPLEMIPHLLRAVRLDPACLDARMLLATIAGGPRDELIEEFEQILVTGETDLGKKFFQENSGDFWLLIETRPYMRARARLAKLLQNAGRIDEAISHFEAMLQLNPNDNQGVRYTLMCCYLQTGRLEASRKLFSRYNEETALWLWARVLERYLATELPEAIGLLAMARRGNRYFEDFLTKRRALPKDPPPYYSPGSVSEGVVCIDTIGNAWMQYPEVLMWLNKHPVVAKKAVGRKPPKTTKAALDLLQ
jgi:tetratricopeptide (TPR) repeat protein